MLALVLPLACFVLVLYRNLRSGVDRDLRSAFLSAAVWWGVALLAGTELLSLGGWLTPRAVAASWVVATGVAAWLAWRTRQHDANRPRASRRPTPWAIALGVPIVLVLLVTGLLALCAWPNQWDTMVYHLPRVDHWIQNRSVSFYPTHIVRQLVSPPWSEYAILHLVTLGGDERAANLVQWFSMAGSLLGVSLIARELGAGALGQLVAALCCATIPMGILQASTSQNDYVTAFWLVCLTATSLAPRDRLSAGRVLGVGAALGLALATKGTAYVLAGPLLALLFLAPGRSARARWPMHAALVLAAALVLNVPHYLRNLEPFGFPLGPRHLGSAIEGDDRLTNEALTPGILISNLARNVSLHVALPWPAFNESLARGLEACHVLLGADVEDPRSTRLYPLERFEITGPTNDPSRTGNPFHLLLLAGASAAFVLSRSARERRLGVAYVLALGLSFLLFCALLKWQPWHSRLHLPLFVLGSALVGSALERRTRTLACAAIVMIALAIAPLTTSLLRPLVGQRSVLRTGRIEQYFPSQPFLRAEYVEATQVVRKRGCRQVGLLVGWDDYEHPIWALLPEASSGGGRIEHVGVTNSSGALAASRDGFSPCALIGTTHVVQGGVEIAGRSYGVSWIGERVLVLEPLVP